MPPRCISAGHPRDPCAGSVLSGWQPKPGRRVADRQIGGMAQRRAVQRGALAQPRRQSLRHGSARRSRRSRSRRSRSNRDRHAPVRDAVQEGRGAVDRIDHPGEARTRPRSPRIPRREIRPRERPRRRAARISALDRPVGLRDDVLQAGLGLRPSDRRAGAIAGAPSRRASLARRRGQGEAAVDRGSGHGTPPIPRARSRARRAQVKAQRWRRR